MMLGLKRNKGVIITGIASGLVILVIGLILRFMPSRVHWLETLSGVSSAAYDVSAAGDCVVGYIEFQPGYPKPVMWRRQGNRWIPEEIPVPSGLVGTAVGISDTGEYVVGTLVERGGSTWYGFIWSQAAGTRLINRVQRPWVHKSQSVIKPGDTPGIYAVSSDGSFLLGCIGNNTVGFWHLKRDNIYAKQVLRRDRWEGYTLTISRDKTLIGGRLFNRPAIWQRKGNSWEYLLLSKSYGKVTSVSYRGKEAVAVGCIIDGNAHAVRWTFRDGYWYQEMIGIEDSCANDATVDGRIIVGWVRQSSGLQFTSAFIWTSENTILNLNNYFQRELKYWLSVGWLENIFIEKNSVLIDASAVSADGRYVVGVGYNARRGRMEAFVVELPQRL